MTKRILHLANFNSANIGNGALIYGTEKIWREKNKEPIEFIPCAWDDYTFGVKPFDEKFVDLINQYDELLVNGAVAFNGRAYLKNTGTRFDLPFELWDKIKVPVIFYGLSYRVWPGQEYHHQDKLKKFAKECSERVNFTLYVRNDGTKEWLKQMTGYEFPEIIDPAMFVPIQDSFHPELDSTKKNVILSLNNEDEKNRYGDPIYKERFLNCLAFAIKELLERGDVNLIIANHYFDDMKMADELIKLLPPALAHQKIVTTPILKVQHAPYFYDLYKKADLAISTRVHSISPSIGLGTPIIPIITQNRIRNFLTKMNLNIGIEAIDVNLAEKLTEQANTILNKK